MSPPWFLAPVHGPPHSAVDGGADRLELCTNLRAGGGTTPSLGLLKLVKDAVKETPIMVSLTLLYEYNNPLIFSSNKVMIRPRVGDFVFSEFELEVMLEDIRTFRDLGIRGFVVGILTREGCVDIERMRRSASDFIDVMMFDSWDHQNCR